MTQRRILLDHNRPHGLIYGGGPARYEQDGKQFDHQGLEILPDFGTDGNAGDQSVSEASHPSKRPRSAAAERMHRARQRRRSGIIVVRDLEITRKHIDVMITRNLLMPAEIGDQQQVANAVRRALDSWIGSPRRKTP